jgi:protein-tyrosine-phosphatase/DNA-binding transcriptional ArsR family regulator
MDPNVSRAESPSFLHLLSNDLRWQLLSVLARGDHRVQELVALTQEPQNLVSYHLKQLRNAHLVDERRSTADGRDIYYSLNLGELRQAYLGVGEVLHPALGCSREGNQQALDISAVPAARVLFLCTENSARSQMAEAIWRHLTHGRVPVSSAGSAPSSIHPYALRVLMDMGIDASGQRAKHWREFEGQSFDYVITVCDRVREVCPVFPGSPEPIHWSLPDPAAVTGTDAVRYRAFREIAQRLQTRIEYLLMQISKEKAS